jgi:hypothetical protein
MSKRIFKKVEEHDQGMHELTSEIENFCKVLEEGLSRCATPPVVVDISEVPMQVAKRVAHG